MADFKGILRPKFGKQYRHELLNNLFFHPYTEVEFLEKELMVSRPTAPVGCLLYTSDAADDLIGGDLGGRRSIKKQNTGKC